MAVIGTSRFAKALEAVKNLLANSGTYQTLIGAKSLGENLISNGTFDSETGWSVGNGWTISGGKAHFSLAGNSLTFRTLPQGAPSSLDAGKTYRITYTLSNMAVQMDADGVCASFGGQEGAKHTQDQDGTYMDDIVYTGSDPYLYFNVYGAAGGVSSFDLDDVSLCEVLDLAQQAAQTIHLAAYVPDESVGLVRPFALISAQAADESVRIGCGRWVEHGRFRILIESEIPEYYRTNDNQSDAELEFKNQIGEIIEDLQDLSGQPGYLLLRRIQIIDGPFRYAAEELQHVMGCWLEMDWGLE